MNEIIFTPEEVDKLVELMYVIFPDGEGNYLIYGEDEDLIQEVNDILDTKH